MATYILCGFANFSSIGIQIGGIGALAPKRRVLLSKYGMPALLAGTYSYEIIYTGVYDSYKYERATYGTFESIDTETKMYQLPDIALDSTNSYRDLRLKNFVYKFDRNFDNSQFSYKVLGYRRI